MNFDPTSGQSYCRIVRGVPEDVQQAFTDLNRDMNPQFVHVFLDKIQRYANKPDRDLFLARYQGSFIAFATIIKESPVPEESPEDITARLNTYACGTGLMVLPEYRNVGVASQLVSRWQQWALDKKRSGVWIVTRQMAHWYQRCFHFSVVGSTLRHKVKKTILAKAL